MPNITYLPDSAKGLLSFWPRLESLFVLFKFKLSDDLGRVGGRWSGERKEVQQTYLCIPRLNLVQGETGIQRLVSVLLLHASFRPSPVRADTMGQCEKEEKLQQIQVEVLGQGQTENEKICTSTSIQEALTARARLASVYDHCSLLVHTEMKTELSPIQINHLNTDCLLSAASYVSAVSANKSEFQHGT